MQTNMFDELYRLFYEALAARPDDFTIDGFLPDPMAMAELVRRFTTEVEGIRYRLDNATREARIYRRKHTKMLIENRKLKTKVKNLVEEAVGNDNFLIEEK